MIFQMYAEGARLKDIVERLEGRTSRGKEWSPQTVRYMLQNEIYVGDMRFGKKVSREVITGEVDELQAEGYVRDHHIPLIDRETWERVQERIRKQRNR